jgi:peptidoglycan pentaglycine glycine transferase (the first glycine)
MSTVKKADWDQFITQFPGAHLLQSSMWGEFKSHFGWSVHHLIVGETGSQILFRSFPFGFRMAYIPKGPLGEHWLQLWPEVHQFCKNQGAFALRVEPDVWEPVSKETIKNLAGFQVGNSIQPRKTIVIDLKENEDDILGRMKQKTRYNIRLASKKDIQVRQSTDIKTFYEIMKYTGNRDRFGIHGLDYYQDVFNIFSRTGMGELFLAFHKNSPLAGLIAFAQGTRAWYFYGASNESERERMPTYLLQWEAMRWAKQRGCTEYDLWGIPDENNEILETQFTQRSDGLWGVYRFKRGFGGRINRSIGAWDYVYSPILYKIFLFGSRIRKIRLG